MANLFKENANPYYYQDPAGNWTLETREVMDWPGWSPGTGPNQYVAKNPDGTLQGMNYLGGIPGQAASGGGEEGGGEEGIEWPTDLFPKSESKSSSVSSAGLPEWGSQWVKDYLAKYAPELAGGLSRSLAELEDPVALNAAEKSNLEYMSQENLNPIISNLGSKGVLNSSTSQNAIAKVLAELGGTSYDRAMTNQQAKINDYLKGMALLSSLLGASRVSSGSAQSQSTQSNAWEPYGDWMDYIQVMKTLEAAG